MGVGEEFSGDPAEFEVIDGIMHCKWPGKRPDLCIPLRVFRINLATANKALAEHDAKCAEVVPLRRGRRRGHAASS